MSPIEADIAEYLNWMQVHNYADTTITARRHHLARFSCFCRRAGVEKSSEVMFELLQAYQQRLFEHRKRDGQPLASRRRPSDSSQSPTSSRGFGARPVEQPGRRSADAAA